MHTHAKSAWLCNVINYASRSCFFFCGKNCRCVHVVRKCVRAHEPARYLVLELEFHMVRSSLLSWSASLTALQAKWARTVVLNWLEVIFWARLFEWLNAHKLKLCKKIGFLQQGTRRLFRLSLGSPSGNMPIWAGQDAGALLSALVSPRPSSIIARSETYLYVRVTWPRGLFCDAPRLKHCGSMNENEQRATGFSSSKFKSLNFFLLYFELCSFVPQLCRFLTTSQLELPGFLFCLPMCICGACMTRQKMQGITESVTVSTYLFIRTWVGWGRKCRLLDIAWQLFIMTASLCLLKSKGDVGSLHKRDAEKIFFFPRHILRLRESENAICTLCENSIVQDSM